MPIDDFWNQDGVTDAATPESHIADALAQIGAQIAPVLEAVQGYRAAAEARGFSPAVAEIMANDYHRELIGTIGAQMRHAAVHAACDKASA